MSLLDCHLEQIAFSADTIAELPFPPTRMFTNALLGSHDITALIRDTEVHERALFQLDSTSNPHGSRRTTRRGTTYTAETDNESMARRIHTMHNNRSQSAVARVLGSDMMEEIKRSAGMTTRSPRGEVNLEVLLRGAEILCNVYPIPGALEKINSLRYRHGMIAESLAGLEDRVATNTVELEQMRSAYGDNDQLAPASGSHLEVNEVSEQDIERELAEIRNLERRKQILEDRVIGMDRDLGGLIG